MLEDIHPIVIFHQCGPLGRSRLRSDCEGESKPPRYTVLVLIRRLMRRSAAATSWMVPLGASTRQLLSYCCSHFAPDNSHQDLAFLER
jgi:hypothetical protein